MSSKIFEEALADAKKLKEVAEENAKKAILEAVTPKIRDFIEEQLLAGDNVESALSDAISESKEEADVLEEEIYLDSSTLSSLASLIGKKNLDSISESKSKEALFNAVRGAVFSMPEKDRENLLNLSHKINESADNLSRSNNEKEQEKHMSRNYYEVDLKALKESIMEELTEEGSDIEYEEGASAIDGLLEQDEMEEPADEGGEGEDMISKDLVRDELEELMRELGLDEGEGEEEEFELPDLDMGEPEGEEPEGEPEDEEEELEALQEVFEIDPQVLRQELKKIRQELREGKGLDATFGGSGSANAGVKNAFGGKGGKAGVKKAFGGGSEGQDVFVNPPSSLKKLNEAIRQLRRRNRSQEEKLSKYRGAVQSLREQLEDLNVFNAKLLYVNKLLQNKNLTESEKKSVIKALDEAKSLSEAKSLYKSLTETFSRSSKSTLTENRHRGSSSRATTSASADHASSNTSDGLSRWQKLAGL